MSCRLALAACSAVLATGCGETGLSSSEKLVVAAATSLKTALQECRASEDVRLTFAGSDQLAGRIRQGAETDVFAAANTQLPEQLAGEGLLERPVVFAGNELVLAVPKGSDVRGLEDLEEPGVTTVLGSETVPVGKYARTVLERAGVAPEVASEEPDVAGVIGKLTQGAADAGLVYRTDIATAADALTAIELPDGLQPSVAYGAAVVKKSRLGERARAYVESLRDGPCQDALRAAGFLPAP